MLTKRQRSVWQPYIDALPDSSQFSIEQRDCMGWVKSPFYTGPDVSQAEGGEATVTVFINRMKLIQQKMEKSDIQKQDVMDIMMLISSENYHYWLDVLLSKHAHCLSDDDHWSIIIDCWEMQKSDDQEAGNTWRRIFQMRQSLKSMTEELPDEFMVYRAGHPTGLSWSLDRSVAEWFDTRSQKLGGTSELYQRLINLDEVLFYTNGRGEQEVVIL